MALVVAIKLPTVSCDDVAIMFVPSALAVRMEFDGKFNVAVRVPEFVTGEFVTVNADGRESPTDVTVPDPLPPVHIPLIE